MNIFVLDENPGLASSYHNDRHVVKMILESAQLLSTAHHVLDGHMFAPKLDRMYKPTHKNHPCSIWTRETTDNYVWLLHLLAGLLDEYKERYHKTHKTESIIDTLISLPINLKKRGLTPFAQAMPDEYKDDDPVMAYRRYYMGDKRHIAQWKTQPPPWWS